MSSMTQNEEKDKDIKDFLEAEIREQERVILDLLKKNGKLTEENRTLRNLVNGSESTHSTSKTPEWYLRIVEGTNSDDESGGGSASSKVADLDSTREWACTACTFDNNASRTKCEICEVPRP